MRDAKSGSIGRVSVGAVFAVTLVAALMAGYGWQRWHVQQPPPVVAAGPQVASTGARPAASDVRAPGPTPAPSSTGTLVATPVAVASAPLWVAEVERQPRVQLRPAPPARVQPLEPDAQSSPARPRLQAWVVYAGQDISVDTERISLPSGARLALRVRTDAAGTVALYTVNPQGVASSGPLWKSAVKAREPVTSPRLRLEGTRGMETIRVQFKPASGGAAVWHTVELLHL